MRLLKLLSIGTLLGAFLFSSADAQIPGLLNQGNVLGNATGAPAEARPVTPQTARGPLLLNIDELTRPGDTNYTILSTDRAIAHTALSVARTDTLPTANSVNAGQSVLVIDLYGVVTGVKTITIARAGSDTINGSTSVTLSTVNGGYLLVSDGISAWSAQGIGSTTTVGVTSLGGISGAIGVTNGIDIAGSSIEITAARRALPTRCVILTTAAVNCSNGGSQANNGTYTTPANVLWLEVVMVGGGAGGGGGNGGSASGAGTNTTFNGAVFQANGAAASAGSASGAGGSTAGCVPGFSGGRGQSGIFNTTALPANGAAGGGGAVTAFGGAGAGVYNSAGITAASNTGSGGGGGGVGAAAQEISGAGGSAGGLCYFTINSPSATYTYAVGTGGIGASPGSDGQAGGNGAGGIIIITEHYGT